MSTGEKMETDAVLVEKVAKGLYEADRDHEATWPLNDDDDGNRGDGAFVRVTPREVVEEYRQHARDALKVVPPLLARPVPMGGQHSMPNGVDTHERYFYQPDPATSATAVTPSTATVDVGEARGHAEALATTLDMAAATGEQVDICHGRPSRRHTVANIDAAVIAAAIRSLSTALETAKARIVELEDQNRHRQQRRPAATRIPRRDTGRGTRPPPDRAHGRCRGAICD